MRVFMIVVLTFFASLLFAKDNNVRVLTLDAQGITRLKATCGAGFLKVKGSPELQQIRVTAAIRPEGLDARKLSKAVKLSLTRDGSTAVLVSKTKNDNFSLFDWIFGGDVQSVEIDLTIEIPQKMDLKIIDGSGSTEIGNVIGQADIIDGSGFLTVKNLQGALEITDGSGSILVQNINGDCTIRDGSGEMTLKQIEGNVDITDGSGAIFANQVEGAMDITDGSGEINLKHIGQTITIRDGSGDIRVDDVNGDLVIKSAGSGGVFTNDVKGRIIGLHK